MHLYFFTYGGGADKWRAAAQRLTRQARELGIFYQVECWTDRRLQTEFPDAYQHHSQLMNQRGNGYWWWKPFLTHVMLERMADGDVLCYLDAGCELNPKGMPKLRKYIDQAATHGGVFFRVWHKEKCWNKMDTLKLFNILPSNTDVLETGQVESGTWLMRRDDTIIDLVRRWEEVHEMNNHHHATDAPSVTPNLKCFREHRHDQSILSLLVKTRLQKDVLCDDQRCWPGPKYQPGATRIGFRHAEAEAQPFLVLRNASGATRRPKY